MGKSHVPDDRILSLVDNLSPILSRRANQNLKKKSAEKILNGVSLSGTVSLSRTGKNYPSSGIVSGPRTCNKSNKYK